MSSRFKNEEKRRRLKEFFPFRLLASCTLSGRETKRKRMMVRIDSKVLEKKFSLFALKYLFEKGKHGRTRKVDEKSGIGKTTSRI